MGINVADLFRNIPQDDFDLAVDSGLLLAAAVSVFYLFFGRLFSLPELLGITLRTPSSEISRKTLVIVSGFIFISALMRTLYHEHLTNFHPYDQEAYLQRISTLRLIISGAMVGFGSQYTIIGLENTGSLGVPTFSLRSIVSSLVLFGSTMLAVTYQLSQYIPATPRVIQILNESLPKNISFDAYLLVSLLVPFICFLIATNKSLKGMVETLLHFGVGIAVGYFLMLLGWSEIKTAGSLFKYSKGWTADVIVVFTVATFVFAFVFFIVKYGFKKPLFSNDLQDKKGKISGKMLIGNIYVGVGFGIGGLLFQSFLLVVSSSSLRIAVFWGIPCIFAMKVVQVISEKSQTPLPAKQPAK